MENTNNKFWEDFKQKLKMIFNAFVVYGINVVVIVTIYSYIIFILIYQNIIWFFLATLNECNDKIQNSKTIL